jgi:hypothetical protein
MKTGKKVSSLVLAALLVSGLLITSCPEGGTGGKPPSGGGEETPRQILATVSPVSVNFTSKSAWEAAAADKKTFTVKLSESKADSYQWYSKPDRKSQGTLIQGATGASFTPPATEASENYYYVVVKVDGKDVASNNALVRIFDPANAATRAETQFTISGDRVHYVRGLGGTGSFMFRDGDNADASPDADVKYIDLLMGEMGCNILRIMVQDDYENYLKNEVKSRNDFAFPHDAKSNFFAVIRRVNELGGYVFANPWTAPAEYKTPKQITGGADLANNESNHLEYAYYLQDFLKWLNQNKAPIFALGICNEPDWGGNTSADGPKYEGMGMTQNQHRDWFKQVGHLTTVEGAIPGYGGGKSTHHVLVMTGDVAGNPAYFDPTINDPDANRNFEILGRHYYMGNAARVTKLAGSGPTTSNPTGALWKDRPAYTAPNETEVLAQSPQMFAPAKPGEIKREIWQTEHDFNYWSDSTNIPGSNVQRYWNSAFAAMNDVDWALRVVHESVFDWWFSSSYSGLVTSYQGTPVNAGGIKHWEAGATEWPAYTYTPRGRAYAHYARYVSETWSLPINQTKEKTGTNMKFNQTGLNTNENASNSGFDAGATDPKISAFEDVNGEFISIVMFTPNASTNTSNINNNPSSSGKITNAFGQGGLYGTNDPTVLSADVGRVEVVLPDGFTATSASALRSYGWQNATGAAWDDVPAGSPRYWIDEPVLLYQAGGKWAVEVTLPGGNIISIMVKGTWSGREAASPKRVRPYTVK